MKYFNVLTAIFLSSVSLYAQDCFVRFSVTTDYIYSVIYLNNKFVGSGKFDTLLNPGKYFLFIDENVDRLDSKSFSDTIFIKDCNDKILDYKFHTGIYLKSDPDDAYVLKNDSLIGHTPLFISPGLGTVRLSKPGFEQKDINLADYDGNPVPVKFVSEKITGSFFGSTVFKIFVSTIVALGAVTAYYKIKADKRFDDYQATGNGDFLNETRRYDLISGITFGALQVNFGFLIYYFLKD